MTEKQPEIPVKDLMLLEEVEVTVKAICDIYNYDYRLLFDEEKKNL